MPMGFSRFMVSRAFIQSPMRLPCVFSTDGRPASDPQLLRVHARICSDIFLLKLPLHLRYELKRPQTDKLTLWLVSLMPRRFQKKANRADESHRSGLCCAQSPQIATGISTFSAAAIGARVGMIVSCSATPSASCLRLRARPPSPGRRTRSTPGRGFEAWEMSRR